MTKDIIQNLKKKDSRTISRCIPLDEKKEPTYLEFLSSIFPYTGNSYRIGITGAPGSGKSTLTDQLINIMLEQNLSVAIIAIDPSSPFSGGALLGDRVRMSKYSENNNVYIRSMGNRGDLGGLCKKAREVGDVLAASGKDVVIFETVGVGQAEHDIVNAADFTVVVLVPESGDEVQLMKAGIIEIADIFVVNKSDRPGSKRIERTLSDTLHSFSKPDSYIPAVLSTTASTGKGVAAVFDKILDDINNFKKSGKFQNRRLVRYKNRIKNIISEKLVLEFWTEDRDKLFKKITDSINSPETPPSAIVKKLISNFN